MDAFKYLTIGHTLGLGNMIRVWTNTTPEKPLRKFLLRNLRHEIQTRDDRKLSEREHWNEAAQASTELLVDILTFLTGGDERDGTVIMITDPCEDKDCEYHEHETTPKCGEARNG